MIFFFEKLYLDSHLGLCFHVIILKKFKFFILLYQINSCVVTHIEKEKLSHGFTNVLVSFKGKFNGFEI